VSFDIDPIRIAESRARTRQAGAQDRVQFLHRNFFDVPFSEATAVVLCLVDSVKKNLLNLTKLH
jgi:hypothetical protein